MAATTEQFILNLAANLAYDLFKAGASRLRSAAFGEVDQLGLRAAYQKAFAAMLGQIPRAITPEGRDHLASLLQSFVGQPNIAAQLIDLALTSEVFSIDEIRKGFFDLGFDVTTLEADFDDLIRSFVKELAAQVSAGANESQTWTSNHINVTRFAAIQVLLDQQRQSLHSVFETVKLLEQTLKEINGQPSTAIRNDLKIIRNSIEQLPLGLQPLARDIVECLDRNEEKKKTKVHNQALEAYLSAVRSQSEQLPYITLPGKPLPLLSTVYIEQIPEEETSWEESYGDSNPKPDTPSKAETIDQVIKRYQHIVLHGGPGIGKSTMLHHLALLLIHEWTSMDSSSLLPVYLQARNLVTSQRSLSESLHQQTAFELGKLLQKPLPKDFFAAPPAAGARWVVMIDGLDEVVSIEARDQLIKAIVFHAGSQASDYRFILASRPLLELDRLPRDIFGHYLVKPFDPHQVKLFANQWFANRPGKTGDDASRFLKQIASSRIDGLAQIPLLLTMAAVVFELDSGETFPTRRVELYRKFVKILVEDEETARETRASFRLEWDKRYGAQGEASADRLLNRRLPLLEYLALWKQEGNSGSLLNESINYVIGHKLVLGDVEHDWLTQQMGVMLRRAGLFSWHGTKPAFVHNTFGEYLAASALARTCAPESEEALALIDYWVEETWREVVLFLLQIWSAKGLRADKHLHHIMDDGGSDGYVFAASALAEGVLAEPLTADRIVFGLLKSSKNLRITDLPRHPHALDALASLLDREFVIDGVIHLACDPSVEIYIRYEVMRLLETRGYSQEAIKCWTFIATSEAKKGSIEHAITSIKRLGGFHELVMIGRDRSYAVRYRISALKNAAQLKTSHEINEGLVSIVKDVRCTPHYRIEAAREMTRLLPPEEKAQAWRNLADDRSIPPMGRLIIARALADLGLTAPAKLMIRELVLDGGITANVLSEIPKQGKKFLSKEDLTEIWLLVASETTLSDLSRLRVGLGLKELELTNESNAVLMPLLYDKSVTSVIRLRAARLLRTSYSPGEMTRIWLDLANDTSLTVKVRLNVANELKNSKLVGSAALVFLLLITDGTAKSEQRIAAALDLQAICGSKLMKAVWSRLATDGSLQTEDHARAVLELQRDERLDQIYGQRLASEEPGYSLKVFTSAFSVLDQIDVPPELRGWFTTALANDVKLLPGKAESAADAAEESPVELEDLSDIDSATLCGWAQNPAFSVKARINIAKEMQARGTPDQAIDAWFSIAYDPIVTSNDRLVIARELLQARLLDEDAEGILLDLIRNDSVASDISIQAINTLKEFGRLRKLTEVANDLSIDRDLRKHTVRIMGHINEITVLHFLRHLANAHPEKEMRRLARHAAQRVEARLTS